MIIAQLQGQIKAIEEQIRQIQSDCPHPKVALRSVNKGNSGFDYEHYWTEHHCLLCDKKWTEKHT